MTQPTVDPLWLLVERIADNANSEAGARMLAAMHKAAALTKTERRAAGKTDEPTPIDRDGTPAEWRSVGVWSHDPVLGLRRDPRRRGDWRLWADRAALPAKSDALRIAWLGESAARGYFFDPVATPAQMLETALTRDLDRKVEVIDLARTGLGQTGLLQLMTELDVLEPDMIVVFAGNNWAEAPLTVGDLEILAHGLREGGFGASRAAFIEKILVADATRSLEAVAQICDALGAPLVLVVPEFNLLDWRAETSFSVPRLAGDHGRRWIDLEAKARAALVAEDFEAAARTCAQMADLDRATGAQTHEIAATAWQALGDMDSARRSLERARDAIVGLTLKHTPRCPGALQSAMRAFASRTDRELVDLPDLFARRLDGALPDRRLFMDYCHLTSAGLRLLVGEVAEACARRLGKHDVAPSSAYHQAIDADAEAIAYFLAAIHNAHHGQPETTLAHCVDRSLAAAKSVEPHMRNYLAVDTNRMPKWVSPAYGALCAPAQIERYLGHHLPGIDDNLCDRTLRNVIASALDGAPRRRPDDRPVDGGSVNLLAPAHWAASFRDKDGHTRQDERAYHRATTPISRFFFDLSAPAALRCKIVARLPGADTATEQDRTVAVFVNGQPSLRCAPGPSWTRFAFDLPSEGLTAGENIVAIHWPCHPAASDLEHLAVSMELGRCCDVLPVFGELHCFEVEVGD